MTPIINIEDLGNYLGGRWVHRHLNLSIYQGEILAIVGGSGSGKTTLLRSILHLQHYSEGRINLLGQTESSSENTAKFEQRIGVMFQQGALFSALTVKENIAFPLQLHTQLSAETIDALARLKIALAGLPPDTAQKYPAELSGGMIKRVAVARAIALDPQLLFLDEPTAGLDPQSANELDDLIIELHAALGLTIVLVTHDLDTLWKVTHRVAFLGEGKVLQVGPLPELVKSEIPNVAAYFSGPRARAAQMTNQLQE